jgi:ATP-dependent DNA ligase
MPFSRPVLLDTEIVVLDDNGNPDFAALWFRSRSGSGSTGGHVCFMTFDVLQRDDQGMSPQGPPFPRIH